MFHNGGLIYVYLVYGIHWMLNVVTGTVNEPQAVLIRSIEGYTGPGRLSRILGIDGSFYGEDLISSKRIMFEDSTSEPVIKAGERIGIDYAVITGEENPGDFIFKVLFLPALSACQVLNAT
jgi:DNA-3-methyladenine glycosylase